MGIYYGIFNKTKQTKVFYFWKDPFCDCHLVMHAYHWDHSDEIYVLSHYIKQNLSFDEKTNQMKLTDISVRKSSDRMNLENNQALGFEFDQYDDLELIDHVPKWIDNKCIICGYVCDSEKIIRDKDNLMKPRLFPEVNIYHVIQ